MAGKILRQLQCVQEGSAEPLPDMQITGFHRDGGFAEFLTAPRSSLLEVPDGVGPVNATLAEPLACAVHGVRQVASGLRKRC